MRILLLAPFFPPDISGEECHVFNLANTLVERGHRVAVATQRMVGVPDQKTLASGVRVHKFATVAMRLPGVYSTSRTHHPPLPDPLGVRELSCITRQERPHVVHAQNRIVNSAVALRRSSPTGLGFGLVLTLHDFSHVCATKRLMRMGSPCEGPAVARCQPCATAHYGPALGAPTAAATALMRPCKNRVVDLPTLLRAYESLGVQQFTASAVAERLEGVTRGSLREVPERLPKPSRRVSTDETLTDHDT